MRRALGVSCEDYTIELIPTADKEKSLKPIVTMKGLEGVYYAEEDYNEALEIAIDALCAPSIDEVEIHYAEEEGEE